MFWWTVKLVIGVGLIVHSIAGHLGFIGHIGQLAPAIPLCIIVFAGAANLYHYVLIRRYNRDISRPEVLIKEGGLFSRVRHPMYFFDLILYLGIALYPMSYWSIALYAAAVVAIVWLAEEEDSLMANRFGDDFSSWRETTSVLMPLPRNLKAAENTH